MTKLNIVRNFILTLIASISIIASASAQNVTGTSLKSRVAVVATETKTNIWVSDFPKSTSVMLFDENDNLISIISTNDFGAAYISLPTSITTTVFAKTMNGEISVSNKAVAGKKMEENVASKADQADNSSKA